MKKDCRFRWWKESERIFVCDACDFADKLAEGFTLSQVHRQCTRPKFGLGDYLAAGLEFLGITKELVTNITGKPCGCEKRQEALNEAGKSIGI